MSVDVAFLRDCPFSIVTPRGAKPSAKEAAILQRARPLWTAGYVTQSLSTDAIGRIVLAIRLTDTGRAALGFGL